MKAFVMRLLRFGFVGAAASLIYGVCAYLFMTQFHMKAVPASVIAYALAIPVSFIGQKYFTFKSEGPAAIEMPLFLLTQGLGLGLSAGIMAVAEVLLAPPIVGIGVVIILIPLLSFVVMNWIIFPARRRKAD